MERIFLSLFLLSMPTYSMDATIPEEYESSRKVSASHSFLVGVKEVAHIIGFHNPLQAIEGGLSRISEAYRYNNLLASITFSASVLAPELLEQSEIISVRLSSADLKDLHHHITHVRNQVVEIAENQNLENAVPFLLNYQGEGALVVSTTDNAFRIFTAVANAFGARDIAHDLKEELLIDMLQGFEKVGALASLIKVSKFKRKDNYRMEEISRSLNVIKLLFKKATTM